MGGDGGGDKPEEGVGALNSARIGGGVTEK